MAEKSSNRCWPGYEPVKGKRPKSQGSCRPKAESKLTGSEEDFRRKRKRQLEQWQAEHPGTRKSAAQHLHAPEAENKRGKKVSKTAAKTKKKRTASTTRKSAKKSKNS